MGGGQGRSRSIVAGGVLLGLLAVVGLASRARTPASGGGPRALSSDILLEYALLLIAALAVVVVPVAIYVFVVGRREEMAVPLPPRRNWMLGLFLSMFAIAFVSVVLLRGGFFHHHHGTQAPGGKPAGPVAAGSAAAHHIHTVRFDWMPVVVVSSLTVAALVAAFFLIPRRPRPVTARRPLDRLVLALERTLDDLRAEPDPRKAVIAAYAQMESALGRAGLPRAPAEAPREYLGRVLPEVGAGASVERLTSLFERAKFSPHEIDAAMKEDAIAALEQLRDELREPV